jgi:pimeloyl-ACP methyl ester carboxylesterase
MNIYFREQGQGSPIILIHGFCETHEIWSGFDTKLSHYGRVISIDLPGFGNSHLPPPPFTIDAVAEIILKWLKDGQIKNPVLVGHSLGGYVVLAMAAMDPQYCQQIVLFHSSIYADTLEKKANRDKVIDFVSNNGVAPFIQTFVPSLFYNKSHPQLERVRSISAATPLNTLVEYTRAMRDRPSREDFFKTYKGHSLIIAGEKDELIPLEVSKKMSSAGLKSDFLCLKDTGHMGMIEAESGALEKIRSIISK